MNQYKFNYRKRFFWRTKNAIGHKYYQDSNRMDVFHPDGSITSICNWSNYDLHLGQDWVLFTKKQMEKESGQNVNLQV